SLPWGPGLTGRQARRGERVQPKTFPRHRCRRTASRDPKPRKGSLRARLECRWTIALCGSRAGKNPRPNRPSGSKHGPHGTLEGADALGSGGAGLRLGDTRAGWEGVRLRICPIPDRLVPRRWVAVTGVVAPIG